LYQRGTALLAVRHKDSAAFAWRDAQIGCRYIEAAYAVAATKSGDSIVGRRTCRPSAGDRRASQQPAKAPPNLKDQ
jgi:hypothetical protein